MKWNIFGLLEEKTLYVSLCTALQTGRRWPRNEPSETGGCQERVHKAWLANKPVRY